MENSLLQNQSITDISSKRKGGMGSATMKFANVCSGSYPDVTERHRVMVLYGYQTNLEAIKYRLFVRYPVRNVHVSKSLFDVQALRFTSLGSQNMANLLQGHLQLLQVFILLLWQNSNFGELTLRPWKKVPTVAVSGIPIRIP
jgi:hypothetical protein